MGAEGAGKCIFHDFFFETKMVNITFLPEICIVGQNTFIRYSWITVAHVDVNTFV